MPEARVEDLLSLDRDVRRGWSALGQWRTELAHDPDAAAADEPLEPVRHVAGISAWTALDALVPSVADAPLRDALRRWIVTLTQARIGQRDEVAWARASSQPVGVFEGEPRRRANWREAWRGAVAARTAGECALWLDAAAEIAPTLADVARTRAARRVEVARRFAAPHPWALLVSVDRDVLRNHAARLLDATEDLSQAVWKEALADKTTLANVLHRAVAREAGEGWPGKLTPRWIDQVFGGMARGAIEEVTLPETLGASSFARALYAFGFAARAASAPSSLPFALARDPAFVAAHRLGFVFAGLAADAEWQARVLGVGRRIALAQSRILARSALLDVRLHAARLLLGDDAAFGQRDQFDELGVRLFGGGVSARLRGAWPLAHDDEPARFVALLGSRPLADRLRDQFDSDWYRNPRAWGHLRALGSGPALEAVDVPALAVQVDLLADVFARALG
jgi:hypothetical protein